MKGIRLFAGRVCAGALGAGCRAVSDTNELFDDSWHDDNDDGDGGDDDDAGNKKGASPW